MLSLVTATTIVLTVLSVTTVYAKVWDRKMLDLSRQRRLSSTSIENRPSCMPDTVAPSGQVNTTDRLRRLRFSMKERGYAAYIITNNDEHQSEILADYDKRLQYISGFSGSDGVAVVLDDKALLWVDGRYLLQADFQLDCNWFVGEHEESFIGWLKENLPEGSRIGIDRRLITWEEWERWHYELNEKKMRLIGEQTNLIDAIWTIAQGRPYEVVETIFIHDLKFAGKSWEEKIQDLRNILLKQNIDGMIVTELDEIAWLFNLRGSDIYGSPLFKSFAFISQEHIRLYVNLGKVTWEVKNHLKSENCNNNDCVQLRAYNYVYTDLHNLLKSIESVLISYSVSFSIYNLIPKNKLRARQSPIIAMKAIKNPTEIKGMKNAHIRDAVAIIDFLALLEEEVKAGKHWDEMSAAKMLAKFRKEQEYYKGNSFETISAFGPNSAIVHYEPLPSTNKTIDTRNVYLLDSGGQYLDGTTDITRTVHFGKPDNFVKEVYTRILMGVIDVMTAVLPSKAGVNVESFARRYLYQKGLNYAHSTTHGIGSFLNVHENLVFEPGAFLSNEPGYYEGGKFGIRLETTMMVKEMPKQYNPYKDKYYGFEPIAFIPFEPNLIMVNMLNKQQIAWLNDYNGRTRHIVGKELLKQKRHRGLNWLMERTKYVEDPCKSLATPIEFSPFLVSVPLILYRMLVSIYLF
ncbi:xaa-Pro aminopeptidase 1-like [Centruroides sculpturatus]|uniref:xaa-Pro aminopeptidase 1-like n=1 Tax=Centruroides sculpturatus TaxID=218467 RepID=UPI000C6E3DD5|nr:xaa-Pro aminopeptidase 1-like [Centruroides sculpturatus]